MSTNRLPNPGFETGDTTGWIRADSALSSYAVDGVDKFSGAYSLLWTTTAPTAVSSTVTTVPVAAKAGQVWSGRIRVKGPGTFAVGIMFHDAAGTQIGSISTGADVASTGAWQQITRGAGVTAPAGTASVRIRLYQRGTGTLAVRVDEADLYQVPSLVGTLLPDLAAVRLEAAGFDDGPVPILRTDANGSRAVRQLDGQAASDSRLVVVDYEPALGGIVRYEVDAPAGDQTSTLAVEVDLGGALVPVVTVPIRPQVRASAVMLDYDGGRESGSIRHEILGASAPVVVLRPMRLRAGAVTFRLETYAQARALEDVLAQADVVLLRQPTFPGLDLYAALSAVRVAPIHDDLDPLPWSVVASYAETKPPAGGLAGAAAWTVADVVALGVPISGVPALFPTVYALTVGPA